VLTIVVKETDTGKRHQGAAKKVRGYLQRIWDEKLDLPGDWRIILSFGSLPDETLATTVCEWQYRMAFMKFDLVRHAARGDENFLFHSCIHELLHIPVWQYGEVSQSLCSSEEARILLRNFEESLVHEFEQMPAFRIQDLVDLKPAKKVESSEQGKNPTKGDK